MVVEPYSDEGHVAGLSADMLFGEVVNVEYKCSFDVANSLFNYRVDFSLFGVFVERNELDLVDAVSVEAWLDVVSVVGDDEFVFCRIETEVVEFVREFFDAVSVVRNGVDSVDYHCCGEEACQDVFCVSPGRVVNAGCEENRKWRKTNDELFGCQVYAFDA